jgi:hypothetical protein
MNFTLIEKPPENDRDYVVASRNDIEDKFVMNLVRLLRQGTFDIKTDPIPIGWAQRAAEEAPATGYDIMMRQVPVNFGELGTAHGVFYFERQSKK